jgi:AraC family transcriptional regulator
VSQSSIERGRKHRSVDRDHSVWSAPGLQVEKTRSWGLISADVIDRPAGEVNWRSEYHRIILALTDLYGTGSTNGGHERKFQQPRGSLGFIASNASARITAPAGRLIQILQSPEIYDSIGSDIVRGGSVDFPESGPIDDPLVSQIATTLAHEMEGGFLDRILVDTLNTALAVRIARQFLDPSKITLEPANGLSRERLERVRDYVEEHLDDRLTLADLAGVACLSPYHFSRSFKKAVGVGPQRFVIQRRIERAKTLMRRSNQPLAVIAQEVGVADQSHLTSLFSRETGMTPGRYRTALA